MTTPKPEGQFWQVAVGDGGDPRRPHPRAATPRSGRSPGYRPTRVRAAAGHVAPGRRAAPGEGTPAEVLVGCGSGASRSQASLMLGPWWCGIRGLAQTSQPPCIYSPPVFADIDPLTLNIDPNQVEARLTERTRALVPVDVFGQPAPIEDLMVISERQGLSLIRDACDAIGTERNGQRIGNQGLATVFAFYPNKQMTIGEGGIIVTNDVAYSRVLRSMSNQGRDNDGTWVNHVRLGYNYRLDEMSAALGISQLRRLDTIIARRARVASWYNERLRDLDGVQVPYVAPGTTRMSWFVYVVRLDDRIDRDRLMADLQEDGIPSRPYFVPIRLQPLYRERFGFKPGDFPVTDRIARTTLTLLFFTDMAEEQVDYVCERLAARLGENNDRRRREQRPPLVRQRTTAVGSPEIDR